MKRVKRICLAAGLAALAAVSCGQAFAECGIASTYSSGTVTANGERYNHMGISAAHKSLPFGTRVVVRNQKTGRSITVRINDRGPFIAGRIIDLSTGAKNALGMDGLAPVCIEVATLGSGGRVREASRKERAKQRQFASNFGQNVSVRNRVASNSQEPMLAAQPHSAKARKHASHRQVAMNGRMHSSGNRRYAKAHRKGHRYAGARNRGHRYAKAQRHKRRYAQAYLDD
jgi:rare lipoprotein A